MADESIREVIVSAVSDALNRSQDSNQEQSDGKVGKKNKAKILPSSFLKKKGKATVQQVWDKDIICLPKGHISNPQFIPIPKGKNRVELAKMGLVGKIRLNSGMEEDDIRQEVRSVFSKQMGHRATFPFQVRTTSSY